jgi:hypothetical protein
MVALMSATSSVANDIPVSADESSYFIDFFMKDTISTKLSFDSLKGADSTVLKLKFQPEKGYEYIFVNSMFSAGSKDTAVVYLTVTAFDKDKNQLYKTWVDTINGSAQSGAGAWYIPFNASLIGHYFDIKLINATGANTVVVPNRMYLYRRSQINRTKTYDGLLY